ncbi:MAG: phosphoribosylformylglycinamidine synthase [Ruminococcaceae bacterium]|nr:phosphoribosylformylglycinamidine synthase [Oscillospiraceae bacterium]
MVKRIYVEKKKGFDVEARGLLQDIRANLGVSAVNDIRVFNRYDVEGIDDETFAKAKTLIFSEPPVDVIYDTLPQTDSAVFAVSYLPGQFDQRADSCAQCIQLLTGKLRPTVRSARVYAVYGSVSESEINAIKAYIINPVEACEVSLDEFETLAQSYDIPSEIAVMDGFISMSDDELASLVSSLGLAMDKNDIKCCRAYFRDVEKRDPTLTEIRMLDTYWSDHCRHTTFLTEAGEITIDASYILETLNDYYNCRKEVYGERKKPVTLMDIATMGGKYLSKTGKLESLDRSEEINACSVRVKVDVDGVEEDWLYMFKNETHNHPTEIEPFGGAATCLGGAIRDPLSGRSYVYQAMRITGAADPTVPNSQTLKGKLSQRKLVTTAAAGYSSYGNQIGLATGYVHEIYHSNYVAKRLEIGAVCGAAPASSVKRERPCAGDIIILLGGRTGRDGCGGATGSSKSHTLESLTTCGAEVQKGNPPEERKLQRLFRDPKAASMIKRCNDFGAGGVSVAIGELADGLEIDLDAVPKKYDGLDGTELAISESQERMAVVVAAEDADAFCKLAAAENLEATVVARVTEEPRLKMTWNGNTIVDISREFIDSNGASRSTDFLIKKPCVCGIYDGMAVSGESDADKLNSLVGKLNICSEKGLVERFDSTIGASSVVLPFGGKNQLTPTQYMAAKFPVVGGKTKTVSVMAYGFDPYVSEKSPYHGAMLAVADSVTKLTAAGADYSTGWLTFQEYFERTKNDPVRFGKPLAALLGAFHAQRKLEIAAIGGKDSMSGTFEDIDVPPTLVSFATAVMTTSDVVTPEFKSAGNKVYILRPEYDENAVIDFDSLIKNLKYAKSLMNAGKVKSAWALGMGGIAEAVTKMALGNDIGFIFEKGLSDKLFDKCYGALVLECEGECDGELIGTTSAEPAIVMPDTSKISIAALSSTWQETLESVFPTKTSTPKPAVEAYSCETRFTGVPAIKAAKPRVLIPVFPGTNCEYDTAARFAEAGADPEIAVICNLSSSAVEDSVERIAKLIESSNILMFPGGFSGGDEPDGSGKFIATFFRNPRISEQVNRLLSQRDGLVLGICNGFQALIKLGLLPHGQICDMTDDSPTLTYNEIGRHQSMAVTTRIASVKSPWLSKVNVGDLHTVAISHGEGRFIASDEWIARLAANGQIATQYVDASGKPTMEMPFNPNGSCCAIEGILSPDGRVFGKMAHSERFTDGTFMNIHGDKLQNIFAAGVEYFK